MKCSWQAAPLVAAAVMFFATAAPDRIHAQAKPTMTAKLVDPDKKAAQRAATVEVTTSGIELVDPALSNEKPVPGQGHLHYQVDKGPIVATPAAKLSFHELAPGMHTILVMLAGNDHQPLGPQQQLKVSITAPPVKVGAPAAQPRPDIRAAIRSK